MSEPPPCHADLDFNGTLQTVEFTADLAPLTERVTISLYSDGVAEEGGEGFLVLIGVDQDELDVRDRGSVDVLQQAVLVSLQDGGECTAIERHRQLVNLDV